MGRLVADAGKRNRDELTAACGAMPMEGLGVMGTRGKHVNVFQHLMGFLKNRLSREGKQQLLGLIGDYRQGHALQQTYAIAGELPGRALSAALNRHPVPDWVPMPSAAWVHQQVYLNPSPKELKLRNYV